MAYLVGSIGRAFRRADPWHQHVYWALDQEMGGLDVGRHGVVSIGMVPIRSGAIRHGESFYSLVKSSAPIITRASLNAHNILPDELREGIELRELVNEVQLRVGEGVLLVHGAAVDLPFLRAAYRTVGLKWPNVPVVDTMRLLNRLRRSAADYRTVPSNLSEARAYLGLPEYEAHHALADALATAELLLVLVHLLRVERLRQLL